MLIYQFLIRIYFLLGWLTSFYSNKSKLWIEGRRNWKINLSSLSFANNKWIWFHCASLGEFNDGKTFIEALKIKFPQYKILLTFFSSTGYEQQRNYKHADAVLYMPLDTKANARYFLGQIKPSIVFFVRNDIWPNYLLEIQKRGIPVFLYSFTLSEQSLFLKFPQNIYYKKFFNVFNSIFVHGISDETILMKNKFNNSVFVSGNSRIDAILEDGTGAFSDEKINNFLNGDFCVIAGSTYFKDKEIFLFAKAIV